MSQPNAAHAVVFDGFKEMPSFLLVSQKSVYFGSMGVDADWLL